MGKRKSKLVSSYILASHNTMTYLKPKNFIGKLVKWSAKCQDRSIGEQLNAGVRMIDIRIKLDKDGNPYFGHGVVTYEGDFWDMMDRIKRWQKERNEGLWCRIMLEKKNPTEKEIKCFCGICLLLERKYNAIYWFGGMNRYDWSKVYYDFGRGNKADEIDEQVCSVQGYGIFPWLWAERNNERILRQGTRKNYLMIDFV